MSETKHTPGPWSITDKEEATGHIKVSAPFPRSLVAWVGNAEKTNGKEFLANAHLIAAAPDQNEELLKVRDFLWSLETATGDPDGTIEARLESINRVLDKAAPK